MDKKKVILLITIVLFSGTTFAQESFYVYFMQNGRRVNIEKSKIELKKAPFEICVEYTAPSDLIVSQSQDSKVWHSAVKGKLVQDIPVFNVTKKEKHSVFDFSETLYLNPETSFCWKKNQTDSLTGYKIPNGRFLNVKKVKKVKPNKDSSEIVIQNFNKDIYLVFIYTVKDKEGESLEIQREAVKIKWVKKYENETKSYDRKKKAKEKERIRMAKQSLKRKQKAAEKEKEILEKLEKDKQKKEDKEKKKKEKEEKIKSESLKEETNG